MTIAAEVFVSTRNQRDQWTRDLFVDSRFSFSCKVTGGRLSLYLNTGDCRLDPSLTTLARDTGQSKRTVIRHIQDMDVAQVLVAETSSGRRSSYRLVIFKPVLRDGTGAKAPAPVDIGTGAKSPCSPVPNLLESGAIRCHSEHVNAEENKSADTSSLALTAAPPLGGPIPAAAQAILRSRLTKEEFESYLGKVRFYAGPPVRITVETSARASFIRKYLGYALDAAFGVNGWEVGVHIRELA